MKKGSIIIFIIVGLIFFCSSVNAENTVDYIILDGPHKFSSGDNPAWFLPQYDDSTWQKITVPGSWQSHRIKSIKGMGWYRIYFTASESFRNITPAILLGRIGDADEVFLNGVRIGSEGLIADRFVEATKVERLYRIPPPELVKYNDSNLLSVRVMNTYLNGGIFDKNIMVGDYNSLLIEKFHRNQGIETKVIFLTMHNDSLTAKRAMGSNVSGFVIKDNAFEDLLYAIKAVASGGKFISPSI